MRREDTAFKDTPKKSFLVSGRVLNNFLNFGGGGGNTQTKQGTNQNWWDSVP